MASTPLTRGAILDACVALIQSHGVAALTVRRLGEVLGVDPTAFYRHFKDKSDLLRAVGDRVHRDLLVDLPCDNGDWRALIREICLRLRSAHMARPDLAELISNHPPLQTHEFELTEALLAQLAKAGLAKPQAALCYHALIEVTVGSAALDVAVAQRPPEERNQLYRTWRVAYAMLDPQDFPNSSATAADLYSGSADDRFAFALDLLLDGIAQRC